DMPEQRTRSRERIVALTITGAVVVLAAIIFAVMSARGAASPRAGAGPEPTVVGKWQTYHDPSGYFMLRIPADWNVTKGTVTGEFGNTKYGVSFPISSYDFGPSLSGNQHISLHIEISPIQTAKQREYLCQQPPEQGMPKQQLGHLMAYYSNETKQYFLYSQTAYVMLQYYYPGVPGLVNPGGPAQHTTPPTPTAVPATQLHADQATIVAILASFAPIPDKALTC
ncbi:MAG TPA: hypothetical protein VKB76_16985, partial [Ktedonobacterales bacterium]|nr:hypothetical protein [Ktedonobacterales bacterium]